MLVITVDASSLASYHSPRRKRQVSLIPLRLLSPQNLRFCGDPIFRRGVMARSYPVRTVIQFSFEAVPSTIPLGTFSGKCQKLFSLFSGK